MQNSIEEGGDVCRMEYTPCRSAKRYNVYDNAKRCKRVTLKRCRADPTKKKMCETAKRGISQLRKRQLCTYIISNPTFQAEGAVKKKQFEKAPTLKKELSETVQREFFTPVQINWSKREKGSIGDAQRTLYLAALAHKLSGKTSVVYEQKGGSKVYWTNYDEDKDRPLPTWRLTFPSHFKRFLMSAQKEGRIQHIFLNMRLYKKFADDPDTSKHANFLLLDVKNRQLYRYEPSGYGLYDVFDMDELDDELAAWAKSVGFEYVPPWDSCPLQLFAKIAALQRMAGKGGKEAGDPGGFCKVWATFMLEQKIRHPTEDMSSLQKQLVKIFIDNNIDMTYFGRSYIERVNQYGNKVLRAHGMTSEDDPEEYLETHWKSVMARVTKN